jgi:hypothetical protein
VESCSIGAPLGATVGDELGDTLLDGVGAPLGGTYKCKIRKSKDQYKGN